jgi:sulfite reductase (NADPH) hemoprotein beta-component
MRSEPASPRPFAFTHNGDRYGWIEGDHNRWHLTVFVENGRLRRAQLEVLRELASRHDGEFRLTPNQNLIVANVTDSGRAPVDAAIRAAGLDRHHDATGLRLHAMACVALPTCPLAMAESERYLPGLIDRIDALLIRHQLETEPITLRMTGCPNGCARPYVAEIGLVGKAPGRYNLYLGGTADGGRLNRLYRENLDEAGILEVLDALLGRYAQGRQAGERFGDYLIRAAIIEPVAHGLEVRVIGEAAHVAA